MGQAQLPSICAEGCSIRQHGQHVGGRILVVTHDQDGQSQESREEVGQSEVEIELSRMTAKPWKGEESGKSDSRRQYAKDGGDCRDSSRGRGFKHFGQPG